MADSEEFSQSVQDIEGDVWPAAAPEDTYLVRTVHRMRQVPIGELDIEGLRIMLSQNVGTTAILPRALDQLEANPLAAGHLYPGALLAAVLRLPEERWSDSAEVLAEVRGIAQRADVMIAEMDGAQDPELRGLVLKFLSDRSEVDPGRTH
ncbi:contact-dependent growth inhibition system immunity protein [Nocardia sp. NPDC060249]|uniref:contact-dependent growth inhibition system immunity protein n=1 Tax=Nocardia sp. NPDC060249 TaxID=3347082 RepID=UPI003647B26A